MKTFISAALLSLMLMGCGDGTDKILASQEETNAKIDSLISFLNEPEEPEEPTRKDIIIASFDSLVAYVYLTTQIDADPEAEDHGHTDVRYVEYYVFQLNKSDLYDGEVDQLYIDPQECIMCGACEPVCPVEAIFIVEDLPEEWVHYEKINADYFLNQ